VDTREGAFVVVQAVRRKMRFAMIFFILHHVIASLREAISSWKVDPHRGDDSILTGDCFRRRFDYSLGLHSASAQRERRPGNDM
jgi:hypothetical protein